MNAQKEKFLLYRIRGFRDEHAFKLIYDEYASAIRRFLFLKLPGREDVDDALSQTFPRAWNYMLSTEVENASALLYTIARGVVSEFYRSRPDSVSMEGKGVPEPQDAREGSDRIVDRADVAIVRTAMGRLTDDQQILITLRHFEGLTARDISRRVGKTENAVRVALHRAMKELRRQLNA